MSRKFNYLYYSLILFFGLLAFFSTSKLSIYLLMLTSMLAWYTNELKKNRKIEFAETRHLEEKKQATFREEKISIKIIQLINAIPSALVYINQRGDLEVVNDDFKTLIKVLPKNIYSSSIDPLIRGILLDAFLNEQQFVKQHKYELKEFQIHSVPIFSEKRYQGCMLIFQDVTLIADGEMRQKQFIADASHELKTPITSIKGMIEILNRPEFNDQETQKEFLLQIEKESLRLNAIVNDLLLQSKVKENKIYLDKTEFNLYSFFDALVHEKRKILKKENIKLEFVFRTNKF